MALNRLITYVLVILTVLFVVAIVATVVIALTLPVEPVFGFHHTAGGFLLMGIWMVFFWAIVIGGIVVFVAWLSGQARIRPSTPEDPRDILRRRYASGEITREQYESMLKDLESK